MNLRRVLATFLLVIFLCNGCAAVQYTWDALEKFPQRTEDALKDPIRSRHLMWQIITSGSGMLVSAACALAAPTVIGLAVCWIPGVIAYYINYEYVVEPLARQDVEQGEPSRAGPYWERGPRDGEKFQYE